MKIVELKPAVKNKIGVYHKNGVILKPHEESTAKLLVLYGFNIEFIRPSNTPGIKNPDVLMSGTIWEMKAPFKYNERTITNKFRKAKKQSGGRAIFDLRNIKSNQVVVEKFIIKLFISTPGMRRMLIIRNDKQIFDIYK